MLPTISRRYPVARNCIGEAAREKAAGRPVER
jgi:hypothetical protein